MSRGLCVLLVAFLPSKQFQNRRRSMNITFPNGIKQIWIHFDINSTGDGCSTPRHVCLPNGLVLSNYHIVERCR